MIEIGELNIKIPGLTEEQGNLIGKSVAEKVSESLPNIAGNHNLAELNIKINPFQSTDTNFMADHIANQIIRQIKFSTFY